MHRMTRVSSYAVAAACLFLAAARPSSQANGQPAASPTASAGLDYEFFKTKVQPIFLADRPGHTRCVVCHTINNAPLHLVPLSPGSTTWNEEQSRRNFELVRRVVVPGYEGSKLVDASARRSRPAAILIMAAASNSTRRTTRSGRR